MSCPRDASPFPSGLLALLLLLPLSALGTRAEADAKAPSLAAAQNAFAFDFYRGLRSADPKAENLFFSPYSIWSALLMAREGARGTTAEEMDALLRTKGVARGAGWRRLQSQLQPPTFRDGHGKDAPTRPAYALTIANALWGQTGYPFHEAFTKSLRDEFGAPLERIDFGDEPAARARINGWVEAQTRERIRDIVPAGVLTPTTRLVLANAIYFKAPWQDAFQERWTKPGPFTGTDDKERTVLYMHRRGGYAHASLDGIRAVALPYRTGATSMWILLPEADGPLAELEQGLDPERLDRLEKAMKWDDLDLYLPKWTFTMAKEISDILARLGMRSAFDPRTADFSGMSESEKLFIGAALHKAFVAVDEEGTEAAAATVLVMKGSAHRPQEPKTFRVDRPFVFLIRHRTTGAVLFLGRVTQPTPAPPAGER